MFNNGRGAQTAHAVLIINDQAAGCRQLHFTIPLVRLSLEAQVSSGLADLDDYVSSINLNSGQTRVG